MKISTRLETIASFIKEGANVIDVGADHGLLEKYLLDNKLASTLLAVENKVGPYETLKRNLKGYDVRLSLSDGIEELDEIVDTIIIAGMGGNLIVDILKAHKEKLNNVKQIVIDAHRDIELVRREITALGYFIEKEKIVFENNVYYFIISFLKGNKTHTSLELEWGNKIKDDPLFLKFKEDTLRRLSLNLIAYKSSEKASQEGIKFKEEQIERLESL